jgi:hypothetical protein
MQHPVAPRELTRPDRRKIIGELDAHYDDQRQLWRGDYSDQKVAEALDLPRKWVEIVRVELYGDHDRNEAAAQNLVKFDDAIALAESATTRLMEMAQEAEKIGNDLKAARAKLLT